MINRLFFLRNSSKNAKREDKGNHSCIIVLYTRIVSQLNTSSLQIYVQTLGVWSEAKVVHGSCILLHQPCCGRLSDKRAVQRL